MKRALVILPNNPGDVLMGLTCVRAMKASGWEAIEYIVDPESEALVLSCEDVDACHAIPRTQCKQLLAEKRDREALTLLSEFIDRLPSYDLVVNLFQDPIGGYLASLIPAQEHRGLWFDLSLGHGVIHDPWSLWLYAIPAQRSANGFHAVDLYCRIAGCLPLAPPSPKLKNISSGHTHRFPAPHAMATLCIQPGSAWIGKMWPLAHWKTLLTQLLASTVWNFEILGAPQEQELADQLQTLSPSRIVSRTGKTRLDEIPGILSHCDGLLCGDTYAMHAAAGRCPILALFGPSNPIETGPYAPGALILQSQSPAAGNFAFQDSSQESMTAISPADVSGYLLNGVIPKGLLQACWSSQTLQLVDLQQGRTINPIPPLHSQSESPWPLTSVTPPHPRAVTVLLSQLHRVLSSLVQQNPTSAQAAQLDTIEQEFDAVTKDLLLCEMYRIARNSIPLHPVQAHVRARYQLVTHLMNGFRE